MSLKHDDTILDFFDTLFNTIGDLECSPPHLLTLLEVGDVWQYETFHDLCTTLTDERKWNAFSSWRLSMVTHIQNDTLRIMQSYRYTERSKTRVSCYGSTNQFSDYDVTITGDDSARYALCLIYMLYRCIPVSLVDKHVHGRRLSNYERVLTCYHRTWKLVFDVQVYSSSSFFLLPKYEWDMASDYFKQMGLEHINPTPIEDLKRQSLLYTVQWRWTRCKDSGLKEILCMITLFVCMSRAVQLELSATSNPTRSCQSVSQRIKINLCRKIEELLALQYTRGYDNACRLNCSCGESKRSRLTECGHIFDILSGIFSGKPKDGCNTIAHQLFYSYEADKEFRQFKTKMRSFVIHKTRVERLRDLYSLLSKGKNGLLHYIRSITCPFGYTRVHTFKRCQVKELELQLLKWHLNELLANIYSSDGLWLSETLLIVVYGMQQKGKVCLDDVSYFLALLELRNNCVYYMQRVILDPLGTSSIMDMCSMLKNAHRARGCLHKILEHATPGTENDGIQAYIVGLKDFVHGKSRGVGYGDTSTLELKAIKHLRQMGESKLESDIVLKERLLTVIIRFIEHTMSMQNLIHDLGPACIQEYASIDTKCR